MDEHSFYTFVDYYKGKFDTSMTTWWSPEQRYISLYDPTTESEKMYVANFIGALDKVYDNRGKEILRAALILTENCKPFENRINGTIKDDWLTEKNFGSIAADCVDVLNHLPHLTDWQHTLKGMFENMKPSVQICI
ncbi:hypothetical protein QKU48_gp0691 [Fadolivirus algeromassiliense]|jgi:hypothetical protein|uniref:Uncharacterized protein n=1 Tax=Fadolivirus FV1/VV64 TaxID=3070911 RepID=A0A7D3UVF6_9VIRU|nr:hypothetical protein QKU48_gp0691 [Fadolivirus algeromassiliense]QKF94149.1 hypothetical protein Fadolivirus_1_691 [Fadolivirus FV1/VV64]